MRRKGSRPEIRVNQLGYLVDGPKPATLVSPLRSRSFRRARRAGPDRVRRAQPSMAGATETRPRGWTCTCWTSAAASAPGRFRLSAGAAASHPFRVDAGSLYAGLAAGRAALLLPPAVRVARSRRPGRPATADRPVTSGRPRTPATRRSRPGPARTPERSTPAGSRPAGSTSPAAGTTPATTASTSPPAPCRRGSCWPPSTCSAGIPAGPAGLEACPAGGDPLAAGLAAADAGAAGPPVRRPGVPPGARHGVGATGHVAAPRPDQPGAAPALDRRRAAPCRRRRAGARIFAAVDRDYADRLLHGRRGGLPAATDHPR